MAIALAQGLTLFIGLAMVGGSLLSLSGHPHWFVRGWDYPRVLIAFLALASGGVYAAAFSRWEWWECAFLTVVVACVLWQCWMILPYTPLWRVQVQSAKSRSDCPRLRLVMSNVQMHSDQFERWMRVVGEADPDLVLAVEVDDRWLQAIAPFAANYEWSVEQPQDNMYGMLLLSRRKLIDPRVRFVVEDEYPSIETDAELADGVRVHFIGVHPPPPEPIRDQDAVPRDAELVVFGREIADADRPTLIAGDLNDVAWSHTTRLFQRLSGLLDPRRGRGLYNTWHARVPIARVPLDHIFHSNHFTLVELRRLAYVGSDHFPMLAELQYEPSARPEQPAAAERTGEEQAEAQEKIDLAEEENGYPVRSDFRKQ
ncbi:MAG: endonuclease/exonuclease/phosphatase family protein [Planctomycetes bacterium]|nr:endonuclease/exonuclease/phosphatase family protein [Planctomycetota bacterium]